MKYGLKNYALAMAAGLSLLIHAVTFALLMHADTRPKAPLAVRVPIKVVALPPKPPGVEPKPEKVHTAKTRPKKQQVASERRSPTPPPAQDVKPVQGLSQDSMRLDGQGRVAAPLGNTLMTDDKGERPSAAPAPMATDLSADPILIRESVEAPQYTDQALDAGFEGTLNVEVLVDEMGVVKEAELKRRVGFGMDQRILDAAKKARFKPRLNRLGQPEAGWTVLKFKMEIP